MNIGYLIALEASYTCWRLGLIFSGQGWATDNQGLRRMFLKVINPICYDDFSRRAG